ncbi:hypothetical protein PI126_g8838 [Phytophthora idaei]|nr:hypothetical protein PI126_g8838 [Phytophthora idaei]
MLLPFLDTEDEAIAELLPFAAANRRLRDLLGELKDVESVSKALQGFTVGKSPSRIDAFNPGKLSSRTSSSFEAASIQKSYAALRSTPTWSRSKVSVVDHTDLDYGT